MREFCPKCEQKFNEQYGMLKVLDMCDECRLNMLLTIIKPDKKFIFNPKKRDKK
jgi:hypothetical protein